MGYPVTFLQRCDFLKILYQRIEDKDKVLTGKCVCDYDDSNGRVVVRTTDGSEYEGAILVGADGVHSSVRRLMANAVRQDTNDDRTGFETTDHGLTPHLFQSSFLPVELTNHMPGRSGYEISYKAVFAVSQTTATTCPMPPGYVYHAYGTGVSAVAATGCPGLIFWFLFVKVPSTQGSRSSRYSDADTNAVIEEFRDMKFCAEYTVGDAWAARVKGDMLDLEEGIVDRWSRGRVVLIGDAIHKVSLSGSRVQQEPRI